MKTKIFLTGLAFVAVTALTSSIYPSSNKGNGDGNESCNGTAQCSAFVDANKDGICDTYENRTTTKSGIKGNGNCAGMGQGQKQGKGKGRNFVDANKNGICDTYENRIKK